MPTSASANTGKKHLLDRYLGELISYGGELWPRGKVIMHLKRCGLDDRSVDRYLQGSELRVRLEAKRRSLEPASRLLQ